MSIHDTKIKELEAGQKLQETNAELINLLAAEKQHTAIIGAMSNVFFGLYYIDLEQNTFQEFISLDKLHHTLGEKGDARAALKHMTDALVGDAHKALMRGFTDFDTIDARLGDKPIIIQEYVARTGGWTRCAIFPVERDETGKNRTVLCTLRWITAEKEQMESQDNLIQALAIPYENIYAVNADTCEAICYRMGQTMNDRYGQKFAAGNYEKNIQTYIENDVLAEDRRLFDRVRTAAGVNELLSDKRPTISITGYSGAAWSSISSASWSSPPGSGTSSSSASRMWTRRKSRSWPSRKSWRRSFRPWSRSTAPSRRKCPLWTP